MELTFIQPAIISIVFGLVVAGIYLLIAGPSSPWPFRQWLCVGAGVPVLHHSVWGD